MSTVVVGPDGQRLKGAESTRHSLVKSLTNIGLGFRAFQNIGRQEFDTVPRRLNNKAPTNATERNLSIGVETPRGAKAMPKKRIVNYPTLLQMAKTDPVTWSLIAMTKRLINHLDWDIVPDVDAQYAELDRWEDQSTDCVNEWGYALDFDSADLSPSLIGEVGAEVKSILKGGANTPEENRKKRQQIAALFRVVKRALMQEATVAAAKVKPAFMRPNNQTEKSLRALQELVIQDLLISDAGVIVKNYDGFGRFAELYRVPGHEIVPFQFPDFTIPEAPDPAYVWYDGTLVKAYYTSDELVYIMQNPQGDGYGMSPVEALVYVNTATLLGDNTFIKNLQEGFIPPYLINLKGANERQRRVFENTLFEQQQKTAGNRGMVVSGVPSEDGEFQFQELPRGTDFARLQAKEYLAMAPNIKALAFGYHPADLGMIMSQGDKSASNVPDEMRSLTMRRAVTSPALLLQEYYNAHIIREEFPKVKNVKFKFDIPDTAPVNVLEQAQADSSNLASGKSTINELRKRDGQRPLPGGHVATKTTGNALVQLDTLSEASADALSADSLDPNNGLQGNPAQPGVVKPVVQTDPKKRNDATAKQIKGGHPTQKGAIPVQAFVKVSDFEDG